MWNCFSQPNHEDLLRDGQHSMADTFPDSSEAAMAPPQRALTPSPWVLWKVCEQVGRPLLCYTRRLSGHLSCVW